MSYNKTLRDIWESTDRSSMNVMKDSGGLPLSSRSSKIKDASKTEIRDRSTALKPSTINIPNKQYSHDLSYLNYNKEKRNAMEDDAVSLISSIWAPTAKDELSTQKNYCENPLINLEIPNVETPDQTNKNTISVNDSCETLSISSLESELSNNYGSDDSQDELNNETFGKHAVLPDKLKPNKSELSLSDLSEATLQYDKSKKSIISNLKNTAKPKKYSFSESKSVEHSNIKSFTPKPINTGAMKKQTSKVITKVYRDNKEYLQNPSRIQKKKPIYNGNYGPRRRKALNDTMPSKFSHLSIETEGILNLSKEDLSEQDWYTSSNQKNINSWNTEKRFAIKTHQITEKRGKEIQKITTYVQGKVIEKSNETFGNCYQKNVTWDSQVCVAQPQFVKRNKYNTDSRISNPVSEKTNYGSAFNNNPIPVKTKMPEYPSNFKKNTFSKEGFSSKSKYYNASKIKIFESNPNYNMKKFSCNKELITPIDCKTFENVNDLENDSAIKRIGLQYNYNKTEPKVCNSNANIRIFSSGDEITKQECLSSELYRNEDYSNMKEWNTTKEFVPEKQKSLYHFSKSSKTKIQIEPKNENYSKDLVKENSPYIKSQSLKSIFEETAPLLTIDDTPVKETVPINGKTQSLEEQKHQRKVAIKDELEQNKSAFIYKAKEIADFIVGCHRSYDIFSSFYNEWIKLRYESINLLEAIQNMIVNSSKKSDSLRNAIAIFNGAANIVSLVPHPTASLGAKIAATFGGIASKLLGKGSYTTKDRDSKEFEVKQIFQKDIDTSSLVYLYGVQCSSQFGETVQIVKSFHQKLQTEDFNSFLNDENVRRFLNELTEYNPMTESIFYKRLKLEYKKLLENSKSIESKAFIRVFEDIPEAVSIIDLLPWKFETDYFDNSIVLHAWEELFAQFHNPDSKNVEQFLRNIQNCLYFLKKEKDTLERGVRELFCDK